MSNLGERMKRYESINRNFLIPNMHTVIRLDGRAFSKFTKRFEKPFDKEFVEMMNLTAKRLCEELQNVKFAYVQSDEISLYLTDTDTYESELPFNGNIQKLTSISASIATGYFVMLLLKNELTKNDEKLVFDLERKLPQFDSRVFQLPNVSELVNCFIWRQRDCVKNSISSVGQYHFPNPKDLERKNGNMVQEMLFTIKGVNWNEFPDGLKRGRMVRKHRIVNGVDVGTPNPDSIFNDGDSVRSKWVIMDCPTFKDIESFFK